MTLGIDQRPSEISRDETLEKLNWKVKEKRIKANSQGPGQGYCIF